MTKDPRWRPLIAEDEIPEGGFTFSYRAGPVIETGILLRTTVGMRAWQNVCRDLSVALDRGDPGRSLTADRSHLACAHRGALYRPEDGGCVAGPCGGAGSRSLRIAVRQGLVCLDTASLPKPLAALEPAP